MEIIRSLLSLLFRIAFLLFMGAIVLWLVSTFSPSFSLREVLSSISLSSGPTSGDHDWLPSPRNGGLFSQNTIGKSFVYKPGEAYNGYGNAYNNNQGGAQVQFVTYNGTNTEIVRYGNYGTTLFTESTNQQNSGAQTGYAKKEQYIRNLSIYEGGHTYTGLEFTGEARNTMFQNGVFPVIIADPTGRVVSRSYAQATTNWSIPGWTRFYVKINDVLPNRTNCTMVFEEGRSSYAYTTNPPVRVAISVLCN
jgi:hypothetical protein